MNKNIRFLLKFGIGIALFGMLLYKVGIDRIVVVLENIQPVFFAVSFLVFTFSVFIAGLNVKMMLSPFQQQISEKKYWRSYLLSRVSGLLLPGRLGEFTLVYFLKKENLSFGQGIAAIVADKIITFVCSGIVGIVALFYFFNVGVAKQAFFIFLGILFLISLSFFPFVRSFLSRFILRKYAPHFENFGKTLFSYLKQNFELTVLNVILTLLRMVVIAFMAGLMFKAVGVAVPFSLLFLMQSIETLVTMIPLTVNGLGTKQAVGVYLYGLQGIPPVLVLGKYILGITIQYVFGLLSFLFFGLREKNG